MSKINIAVVQMNAQEDTQENLKTFESYVKEAAGKGAEMIFFPETIDYIGENHVLHAIADREFIREFFSKLARKYQVYLHCGSVNLLAGENHIYNRSMIFSPSGELLGKYDKLHMFDVSIEDGPSYMESQEVEPGNEIVVVDTKRCVLGCAICYDLRFPEIFRLMAENGAEMIAVPANFTWNTGVDHWEILLRARAIENACFIVAAGQTGEKRNFKAFGNSMIIDPWGRILARADENEGVLVASVDLNLVAKTRKQIPSLKNRRKDIYELTSDKLHIYREDKVKED